MLEREKQGDQRHTQAGDGGGGREGDGEEKNIPWIKATGTDRAWLQRREVVGGASDYGKN